MVIFRRMYAKERVLLNIKIGIEMFKRQEFNIKPSRHLTLNKDRRSKYSFHPPIYFDTL